ncbi:hypothetical protein QE152_g39547 [Popillia japonica]|uniref:Peptidase aspartic putative domain-containing protein n=1 Tax=Popillia japonica TaxID=7064 RepID=A0AAW1HTQ0_POPJA
MSKLFKTGACDKGMQKRNVQKMQFKTPKHHTLLHNDQQKIEKQNVASTSSVVVLSSCVYDSYVLLSTVLIQVRDHVKKWHTIRALLDSGSQSSYVTRQLSDIAGFGLAIELRNKTAE